MEQHFDEKTLARLGMFGLTEYEAKVYLHADRPRGP